MRKLENCLQAENDQEAISCIRHIFQTLSAGTPDAAPSIQRRLHYLFDTVRLYLCERDESSSLSKRKDITPKKGQNLDDLCEELCDALHAIQKAEEDDPLKKKKNAKFTKSRSIYRRIIRTQIFRQEQLLNNFTSAFPGFPTFSSGNCTSIF